MITILIIIFVVAVPSGCGIAYDQYYRRKTGRYDYGA